MLECLKQHIVRNVQRLCQSTTGIPVPAILYKEQVSEHFCGDHVNCIFVGIFHEAAG